MTIFKCPYCAAEYELTTARLSFQQRSYAKCQVCHQTMYSWSSRNVPRFTLTKSSESQRHIVPTAATKKPRLRGYMISSAGRDAARRTAVIATRDRRTVVLCCAGSHAGAAIDHAQNPSQDDLSL
jgi:hypothetical protein